MTMSDRRTRRMLRRRTQPWAEQLMENSSLRDNLPDEQATQLLDWGLAQIKQTAVNNSRLPEADADPLLEKDATAVRLIMQGINDLIGGIGQPLEFDIIDDTMTRLLKNLRWLTSQKLTSEQLQSITDFNQAREAGDKEAAFAYLMKLLPPVQNSNPPATETE